MSALASDTIPFSYEAQQQGLRLLELPPELLELVNSPNPPRLQLKSSAASITTQPSHIVLCTPSRTYQLRQVQSSNTVFITRPVLTEDAETGITDSSISAFAKCSSILELHLQVDERKTKAKTAEELLQRILPFYSGIDDDAMEDNPKSTQKEDLFEDVPYSEQECEKAWRDLIAFEKDNACWRASPKLLSELWDMLLETAQAEGIHLENKFELDQIKSKLDKSAAPEEIVVALLCYLCQTFDLDTTLPKLDRAMTVKWTLEISAMTLQAGVSPADLLSCWQNRLPEAWRAEATTEAAEEFISKCNQEKGEAKAVNNVSNETAIGAKRPMKGRDWHERFKKLRK